VVTGLALLGKFFISFTFNGVFVVTAEAYPTEIRNTVMSLCAAQSRIGGVVAPYVQLLGSLYWFPIPFIIYGTFALLAAVTYILVLPETKGIKLMDKIEDLIELQRTRVDSSRDEF
jgi:OCT family organic cation transporter-like MFS transporter 4/5